MLKASGSAEALTKDGGRYASSPIATAPAAAVTTRGRGQRRSSQSAKPRKRSGARPIRFRSARRPSRRDAKSPTCATNPAQRAIVTAMNAWASRERSRPANEGAATIATATAGMNAVRSTRSARW